MIGYQLRSRRMLGARTSRADAAGSPHATKRSKAQRHDKRPSLHLCTSQSIAMSQSLNVRKMQRQRRSAFCYAVGRCIASRSASLRDGSALRSSAALATSQLRL
jgi:hypothetical protein